MTLDGLIHFFWENYDSGKSEKHRGRVHLAQHQCAWRQAQTIRGTARSRGCRRTKVSNLNLNPRDPTKARGMFIFNVIECSLDQVEKITYALNQDQLYTGVL